MSKIVLPEKLYKILKWLLIIFVPAFNAWFPAVAEVWGWPIPVDAIVKTVDYTAVFLAAITLISNVNYYSNKKKEEIPAKEE